MTHDRRIDSVPSFRHCRLSSMPDYYIPYTHQHTMLSHYREYISMLPQSVNFISNRTVLQAAGPTVGPYSFRQIVSIVFIIITLIKISNHIIWIDIVVDIVITMINLLIWSIIWLVALGQSGGVWPASQRGHRVADQRDATPLRRLDFAETEDVDRRRHFRPLRRRSGMSSLFKRGDGERGRAETGEWKGLDVRLYDI